MWCFSSGGSHSEGPVHGAARLTVGHGVDVQPRQAHGEHGASSGSGSAGAASSSSRRGSIPSASGSAASDSRILPSAADQGGLSSVEPAAASSL